MLSTQERYQWADLLSGLLPAPCEYNLPERALEALGQLGMVPFLPEEAVVHISAGNTRGNIRTPDLLCWETAECPDQADSQWIFLQGFFQNLYFILEYFTEIGDLLFSLILYAHVQFVTQTLFNVPDQLPRKCSDTDHCH